MKKIIIINGPNLNLLGRREPEIYGRVSFDTYLNTLKAEFPDVQLDYYQSNHEGDLIDKLQEPLELQVRGAEPVTGIVLNAGGYTHTSVALRDAVTLCPAPVVEVHVTDISHREAFRRVSLLTDVCAYTIIGHGTDGYLEAVQWLLDNQTDKP